MSQVADGSAEALGLLHRRFARLIFGLAVQSLDRAAAEDLVQEVFLAVWRNARRFEPERGTVRAWVLQITMLPDASSARLIAESPATAALPDALEVTLEPRTKSAAPSGPVVVAWEP